MVEPAAAYLRCYWLFIPPKANQFGATEEAKAKTVRTSVPDNAVS